MATPANNEPRINDRIRAREVRLVSPDGAQIGIKPLPEALAMARELELDLVEVADKANPPVCRIMDYGKYKYEAAQKAKETRRKSTNVVIKEMKYRPKIGAGDFDTKTRKVEKFLAEGHKVKITIMFRGREMQHPELGRKILDHVATEVNEVGRVEIFPKQDGRNMIMVLAPDKKAQAAAEKKRAADESEAQADPDATAADLGMDTGSGSDLPPSSGNGSTPAPAAPATDAAPEAPATPEPTPVPEAAAPAAATTDQPSAESGPAA